MKRKFAGWESVAACLMRSAEETSHARLNEGQRASLRSIAARLPQNGILIADEVGMGKTRIAVELSRCVTACGGRVAILVPPGLGYQWQTELRDGQGPQSRGILRSLWQFMAAWGHQTGTSEKPWFDDQIVLISHDFTNWRLGENADSWRWSLLPELYARYRKDVEGRWPRTFRNNESLGDSWVSAAADSIYGAIPLARDHEARRLIEDVVSNTPWPGALSAGEYGRTKQLRPLLEKSVGLGLGIFDLVIVDEAHKSRKDESGLSRLLENVVLQSKNARRVALTATPVELNEHQWNEVLSRIGVPRKLLESIMPAVIDYALSVRRLRSAWRTSTDARMQYDRAAKLFHAALSPFLLRRDKREDSAVRKFAAYSGLQMDEYRSETQITIETMHLSPAWRKAVCAAESLSLAASHANDSAAKRLRLTLGNGHGIAAWLDETSRDEVLDAHLAEDDNTGRNNQSPPSSSSVGKTKREERTLWWMEVIRQAFIDDGSDNFLYDHPATVAVVEAIEAEIEVNDGKVLVFGRYTRPLRSLVDLINARAMLRCVHNGENWPQSKVHGDDDGSMTAGGWPAVKAAHRQLGKTCNVDLAELDSRLATQYLIGNAQRQKRRDMLIEQTNQGMTEIFVSPVVRAIFDAFVKSAEDQAASTLNEAGTLVVVSRAMAELLGDSTLDPTPTEWANCFQELIEAATDQDESDPNGDGELDETEAAKLWESIESRLREEYSSQQGGFARLMYGETKQKTRRLIQLAFNRRHSFPRVLVAQSKVGREGLNLHKSCRVVMLIHPEWNPGIVEQQIGRVDRVGSRWEVECMQAIAEECSQNCLPRIEVRPVVFSGTYDEHNWQVLRERWDDYRAQLHGVIVPLRLADGHPEDAVLLAELAKSAPNFSPLREFERGPG